MEKNTRDYGQGIVEYGLILVLVAVVIILVLTVFGDQVSAMYSNIIARLEGEKAETAPASIPAITNDFYDRIMSFYDENGRWPKSWGDESFTEIGLDPDDWDEAVSDVKWIPHGNNIGLSNVYGDDVRLYVDYLDGTRMEIYTVVWCYPVNQRCYYKDMLPKNEVDITTLEVVYNE